jgi:hypothetical protein
MPKINLDTLLLLEKQIAVSRCKLQALWDARGYTDTDVLAISVELDELMNQYQRLSEGVENEDSGS